MDLAVVGRIVTPFETIPSGVVLCRDDRIAFVGPIEDAPLPEKARVIDAGDGSITPGLIDLQVNGAGGHDVMTGRARVVASLARFLPSEGVTSFLPTIITAPHHRLDACLTAVGVVADGTVSSGARVLGAHLEGPFLSASTTAQGIHNVAEIRPFTTAEWNNLRSVSRDCIRLVTIAPEPPGHLAAIPLLRQAGAVVAIGHTDADYETIRAAVRAGATLATHAFNAMRGFHHRSPGALGAVLDLDALTATVIPDGQHVHPAALRLLVRAKGPDRVVAVSDSIWIAGLPPGEYGWEGQPIVYDGLAPRGGAGRLAGSGITLRQGVRELMDSVGLGLADALRLATVNPARALGLDDLGSLATGKKADIVIFDANLDVRSAIVGGEVVYDAATHRL